MGRGRWEIFDVWIKLNFSVGFECKKTIGKNSLNICWKLWLTTEYLKLKKKSKSKSVEDTSKFLIAIFNKKNLVFLRITWLMKVTNSTVKPFSCLLERKYLIHSIAATGMWIWSRSTWWRTGRWWRCWSTREWLATSSSRASRAATSTREARSTKCLPTSWRLSPLLSWACSRRDGQFTLARNMGSIEASDLVLFARQVLYNPLKGALRECIKNMQKKKMAIAVGEIFSTAANFGIYVMYALRSFQWCITLVERQRLDQMLLPSKNAESLESHLQKLSS